MRSSRSIVQDKPVKEFQVALLMEDITEAKLMTNALREMGIFAHYYNSLDEMWLAVNTETPDLAIIDVKMMSQGSLLFKTHPKVRNQSLKYSFFYNEKSEFLLNSAFGLNHYGFIKKEINIIGQLQSILRRRNEELRLEEENLSLTKRLDRIKEKTQLFADQQESEHVQRVQMQKMTEFASNFGTTGSEQDFYKRIISHINDWDLCKQFGVYKLNSTRQKLIAPKSNASKYRKLPDLWLSAQNMNGITENASEMAYEVSYGLMDESIKAIRVFGTKTNPDILIIGIFDEVQTSTVNWSVLEDKLNSEYRKVLAITNNSTAKNNNEIDIFEAFQYMDDIQYHNIETGHKIAMIDLSVLTEQIKQNHSNRFHWKAFNNEFRSELLAMLSGNYKLANYGADNLLIFFDRKTIDRDYNGVKALVKNFEYWRFFENSSSLLSEEISPEFRFIGPSSINVMRQTSNDFSGIVEERNRDLGRGQLEM